MKAEVIKPVWLLINVYRKSNKKIKNALNNKKKPRKSAQEKFRREEMHRMYTKKKC